MLEQYQNILTTEELAEILRLNVRTVAKLVKDGKLPAMKVASQFRFSKQKIIEWMESQMNGYSDKILAEMEKGSINNPFQIHKMLFPSNISLRMKANAKEGALREIVDLSAQSGFVRNKEELLRLLELREKLHPTAMGNGIAFPHPRSISPNVVERTLIVIGVSKNGIDFDASDGLSVKIFIMLAEPVLTGHLQILSRLTRIFHDRKIRKNILNASKPRDVINIIRDKELSLK